MHRFTCLTLPNPLAATLSDDRAAIVELDTEQSHHAGRVLRLREGEAVELLDGQGGIGSGTIVRLKPTVAVRITAVCRDMPPRPRITLAAAMPKGSHADEMVDQLSQLGADELTPLITQRSVVDPRDAKLDRLRKRAQEACKQCGRSRLMTINSPMTLDQALALPASLKLIALPEGVAMRGDELVGADDVLTLIGPEGGWTDEERQAAIRAGCRPWRIAPHILRIETAAVAAASLLRYAGMLYHLAATEKAAGHGG
ncbi:MAG: 16S rRNA (uracil(1498)-N(3))-methyltransferase [Phycisphaeraceae bacterium]|nr:16S rRNA (uracil(1498)-N(3))-methyltransferase [Phycisphaeraceae bacterium]